MKTITIPEKENQDPTRISVIHCMQPRSCSQRPSQPFLEHASPVIISIITQFFHALLRYAQVVGQNQILVRDNSIMASAARPVSVPFIAEVAPAEEVVSAGAGCETLGLTEVLEVSLAVEVMLAGMTTVVDVVILLEDNVDNESGEANGVASGQ